VAVTFNEATRRLLDGGNFATVATINPDGGPHSSVVWFLREGDALLSTTAARQKARNLARDPRCVAASRQRVCALTV
jgi:PPOX class probable F420-dependent enzyme